MTDIVEDQVVLIRYEIVVKSQALNDAITANKLELECSADGYYVKGHSPQQAIVTFVDFLADQLPGNQPITFEISLSEVDGAAATTNFKVHIGDDTYSVLAI